jgi:hypothetical protein
MKAFILLICFSFGMLLTMPPGNQAQASNTHQVTLVSDVGQVMPAYADQLTFDFVALLSVVQEIGVYERYVSELPIVYTADVVQKRTDFNSFYCLNYRTCLYTSDVRSVNKRLVQKNKVSAGHIKIRDDTSV